MGAMETLSEVRSYNWLVDTWARTFVDRREPEPTDNQADDETAPAAKLRRQSKLRRRSRKRFASTGGK